MELIKWSDMYSVSNKEIDRQHKELIDIINKVFEAISKRQKDGMENIIKELKDYSVYHFNYEEKILEKFGYTDTENHKNEHDKFIKQVEEFENDLKLGKLQIKFDIFSFLKSWLMGHIVASDKKYFRYFKKNNTIEYFK